MNQEINRIISFNDITSTIESLLEFLKVKDISFDKLHEIRTKKITDSNLSSEEKEKHKDALKDIHVKKIKTQAITYLIEYFNMQIRAGQIALGQTFNFIDEKLTELTEKFPIITFDDEEVFEIALAISNSTFENSTVNTTRLFDEKEKELFIKKAEETQKLNRSFGRDTEQIDSLEDK